MSAQQTLLDRPAPRPAGPTLTPGLQDAIGGYHRDVGHSAPHWIAAAKRFAKTKLLEVTVWGLLIAWWVVLGSLVLRFLPLATVP